MQVALSKFLASDLSYLKEEYDQRFTLRSPWGEDGQLIAFPKDALDEEIAAWVTAYGLPDNFAMCLRAQPLENAQRIFKNIATEAANTPPDAPVRSLLKELGSSEVRWLLTLQAIGWMLDDTRQIQAFEALSYCCGIAVASEWMHTLYPEDFVPVSGELLGRSDRLQRYLTGLGLSVEWPDDNAEPALSWLSPNRDILDWASQMEIEEPWKIWAILNSFAPSAFPDPEPVTKDSPDVWLSISSEDSFQELDNDNLVSTIWTCNKKVKQGDIVLMYCMRPVSAITHRFTALCDAFSNPFQHGWTRENTWTELGEREAVPWLEIKEMKADAVLGAWGVVRANFQSANQATVSPVIWKRLQELIDEKSEHFDFTRKLSTAEGETSSGLFGKGAVIISRAREAEFEEQYVIPLLQRLGWDLLRNVRQQERLQIYAGSRMITVRADFVLYSDEHFHRPVVMMEVKRAIASETALARAVEQAESYALKKQVQKLCIVAPEGLWIFKMHFPGHSELLAEFSGEYLDNEEDLARLKKFIDKAVFSANPTHA